MFFKIQIFFFIFLNFTNSVKNYQKITFDNQKDFDAYVQKHFNDFGQNIMDDFDQDMPNFMNKVRQRPLSIYDVGNFLQSVYVGNKRSVGNPFLKQPDIFQKKKNKILNDNKQSPSQGQNLNISKLTFDNINNYRAQRGLAKWKWDENVYNLCQQHTAYQLKRNNISHDNFSQRLKNYPTKNENVAYFMQSNVSEQEAADKFFDQWKKSPGHHRNMIARNVKFGAVGVSVKGKNYYATMIAVDNSIEIFLQLQKMRFNETQGYGESLSQKSEFFQRKRRIQKDRYIPKLISKIDFQIPFQQHNFMKKDIIANKNQESCKDNLNSAMFPGDPYSARFIRSKNFKILNFSGSQQNDLQHSLFPQIFKTEPIEVAHNKKYFFQKKELCLLKSPQQIHDSFYFNILDMNQQDCLAFTIAETLYLKKSITNTTLSEIKLNLWDTISSIKFSTKIDNLIAVGTKKGDFALCDIGTGKFVRTFNQKSEGRISTIDWAQNIVANGQKEGKIYLRDTKQKKNYIGKIHTHKYEVCQLKFNPHNSNYLISGGNDDLVFLYDIRKMKHVFKIEEHNAAVKALAWSNQKSNIFVSGGGSVDRRVCLWDSHEMIMKKSMTKESQICNLDYTCDGLIVASQGFPLNQIEIFDPKTLRTIEIFRGHSKRVLFMTSNNKKDVVITGSPDNTIRYWNVRNLKTQLGCNSGKEELNPNANGYFLR